MGSRRICVSSPKDNEQFFLKKSPPIEGGQPSRCRRGGYGGGGHVGRCRVCGDGGDGGGG
jgi:hypothetical protein